MAIFAAPAYPERQGITESFAPEAKGMLALVNPAEGNVQNQTSAITEGAVKTDHLTLNPPDDSPAAKLERIMSLIRKGEPAKALDRASLLLNGPELAPELKLQLRQTVEAGLHDLTIAGRGNEANAYRMQLLPMFEPAAPQPTPQFAPRLPAPGMGMVA
jgi:hypothetical protein